jgi:membrane protease YdiL (CAAX protease family)
MQPTKAPRRRPSWGLNDAALAYLLAFLAIFVVAVIVQPAKPPTIGETVLLNLPMWIVMGAWPIWATTTRGSGPATDLGWTFAPKWIPVGLLAGAALQLVLPYIYGLFVNQYTIDKLGAPAQKMLDSAPSTLGKVLLAFTTVVLAPVTEELFYRGLVQRSFERLLHRGFALLATAVIFGVVHFQLLQLPGLIAAGLVFGALAMFSRSLSASIAAHLAFNAVAIYQLFHGH